MPARETVAGVAVRRLEISNNNLITGVSAILSLLASVNICKESNLCSFIFGNHSGAQLNSILPQLLLWLLMDNFPIDKDSRACQNISIQFPCVFVCLSFSGLFNSFPLICNSRYSWTTEIKLIGPNKENGGRLTF